MQSTVGAENMEMSAVKESPVIVEQQQPEPAVQQAETEIVDETKYVPSLGCIRHLPFHNSNISKLLLPPGTCLTTFSLYVCMFVCLLCDNFSSPRPQKFCFGSQIHLQILQVIFVCEGPKVKITATKSQKT